MAYATTNPYTGEVIKTFPTATDDEVKAAIDLAHETFLKWRETSYAQRAAVFTKAASILREHRTDYASTLTLEMGKLLTEAELEVDVCIGMLEYYAKHGEQLLQPRTLDVPGFENGQVQLLYQPQGILHIVEPWNFPYYQIVRVAAPNLFLGNTALLKHASNVPQCAARMVDLFEQAGAPKGALVNVYSSHSQSELIMADPRVRGVALTGSEPAGSAIAQLAAKYVKKSTLELGGADAFIVLEDAEIDKTVKWAVFGRHWNAGQVCVSSKRMIVVDSVYDEFLEKYTAGVAALKAGDPMDRDTDLAPESSQGAADELAEQVKAAVAAGAHAVTPGTPVPTKGAFFQPTILTEITPENPAYYTEMFGPVSSIYRVADEAAAIKLANDSPFGLGGSVFTKDIERGKKVAAQLDTGMVFINHPTGVAAEIPFGGVKHSGYGHELIDLGLYEFANIKVVVDDPIDSAF